MLPGGTFSALEELDLSLNAITNKLFLTASSLPKLSTIRVASTATTDEAVRAIHHETLKRKDLLAIDFADTRLTDSSADHLRKVCRTPVSRHFLMLLSRNLFRTSQSFAFNAPLESVVRSG